MNSPYFLIPITLAIVLYYLLGSLMVQSGIISVSVHRRFWNFILLFVFLGCALLGVLLTININYKLGWSFVKVLLVWHVQLGIAMSVVAFIHTLWHSSYFSRHLSFKRFQADSRSAISKHQLLTIAFAVGLLSVSLQVLLIRQFTKVFQGNELMLTWIIGIWMILSGFGAWVGAKAVDDVSTQRVSYRILWFMIGSAAIFIFFSGEIRQTFFPSGVLIAPHVAILMVTLMMVTTAFPSGVMFAILTKRAKSEYPNIYAYESLGSLVGGLILSVVIIWFLNTYLAIAAVGFIVSLMLSYPFQRSVKFLRPLFFIIAGICIKIFGIDTYAEAILLPGQKVLSVTDSPYGSITVTGSEGQHSFFGNGTLLFVTENTIYREEVVHYAMAQHKNPKTALLVSGGYAGLAAELGKYKLEKVDYVEPNPHLFNQSKRFSHETIPESINVITGDIRNFLRNSDSHYDVVIIALPEPTSLEQNRYYSREFINLLKKHLTSAGVLSYTIAGIGNYPSVPRQKAYSSLVSTISSAFKNVKSISGERQYLLASDSTVRIDMAKLLQERNIGLANSYVSPEYINDDYIAERNLFFHKNIAVPQKLNTDNQPWPVLQNTLGYLSMFGQRTWILWIIGIVLLLIPFVAVKGSLRAMYAIGFAGSAIQTLYLLSLQIGAGILYGALGAMIAIFMGGLAAGALTYKKFSALKPDYVKVLLILSYVVLIALWIRMVHVDTWLLVAILCLGTVISSYAVGYLYVHITESLKATNNQPAKTYAADLWGSAAGIVIVTLLLIPSIGVIATAAALAAAVGVYIFLS